MSMSAAELHALWDGLPCWPDDLIYDRELSAFFERNGTSFGDAFAAALLRDGAVRWLAERAYEVSINAPGKYPGDDEWMIEDGNDDGQGVFAPTLDHALAAAVRGAMK